ncbi:MAG TPA: hypothetical protein VJC04_02115 [Candidatus Paceibacterota bacterium]
MMKSSNNTKISVAFIKEGNQFVAYSPALDLSTCGNTLTEARSRFAEAAKLFFEELKRKGTLKIVLKNLGWKLNGATPISPLIVAQGHQNIPVLM